MTPLGRKPAEEKISNMTNILLKKLQFYKQSAEDVTSLDKMLVSKREKDPLRLGHLPIGNYSSL